MKTSKPSLLAALKINSMFSIVLFSSRPFANEGPRQSFFAQDVVLRIDKHNRGVFRVQLHCDFLLGF